MNAAQIHLGLNHLPIAFTLIGIPLLVIALKRNSLELKATASMLIVLSALVALPVYFSGDSTEEIVEHRPGVSEKVIHEHEEAGEFALIFVEIFGALTLALFLFERFKRHLPPAMWWGLVLLGLINIVIFIRTAHLGGLIRHDELSVIHQPSQTDLKENHEKDD